MTRPDLKSRTFNTFTILQETAPHVEPGGRTRRKYLCICRCGTKFTATLENLTRGKTKSCGCLRSMKAKKSATKHGMCRIYDREYAAWCMMRTRNKGAVSPLWDRFDVFICDMGPRPEGRRLRRKDPSKPFEPGNCYWGARY